MHATCIIQFDSTWCMGTQAPKWKQIRVPCQNDRLFEMNRTAAKIGKISEKIETMCKQWNCYNSHKNTKFILNISILLPSTILFTHNLLILLTPYNQIFIQFQPQMDNLQHICSDTCPAQSSKTDRPFYPFLFLLFYFIHFIRTLLSWILHHGQISLSNHMNKTLSLLYPITCIPTPHNISPK